eukprot:Selendium_serpulae@DN5254_c0_g1_i2.p1
MEMRRKFVSIIESLEGQEARVVVFNTRTQTKRDVWLYPMRWQGTGLLGATVQYDVIENAENQACRVLDVYPNSPAAEAGLVAWKDYILGTPDNFYQSMDDLIDGISAELGREVMLLVYNADTEKVREVILRPNFNWGGQGCVGCDIGSGYLHKIRLSKSNPVPSKRAVAVRTDPQFDQQRQQQYQSHPQQQQHYQQATGAAYNDAAGVKQIQNVADMGGRLHPGDPQMETASTTPETSEGQAGDMAHQQQQHLAYQRQQQYDGVPPAVPHHDISSGPASPTSAEHHAAHQPQPPPQPSQQYQGGTTHTPPMGAAGQDYNAQQAYPPQGYGQPNISPYNQPYAGFPSSPYDAQSCQQTVTGAARPGVIYHSNTSHQ